ncbi:MAG: recombinase family protein [Thermoflexales bacterium]|nr:recombinase family protein [Thermoflexales bacterium]
MQNTILRAAGYTRVSMREQVDGHSLDAQVTHIKAYIAAQGWHLAQVYTDAGISAKKGSQRPAYEQMLTDARTGQFDVVVVDKIDRFSRHLGSLLTALDQLNEAHVAFASVQEHLDLTTPWGKLMLTVLGMLAEIYIDNLRQETRKGKIQRARKGLWNGNVPFGYCKGLCSKCTDPNGGGQEAGSYCPNFGQADRSDGKLLILHPIESVAVQLAFEWYTTGKFSDGQIASMLNAYTHHLPDGSPVHFRTKGLPGRYPPQPFTKDAVRDILQRRLYIGQVIYRGTDEQGQRRRRSNIAETFNSEQPVLIDQATFDKAQEIRQTLTCAPRTRYSRPTEIYPLSGLIRCADCGLPLRAASTRGRRYYRDSTRIEHSGTCEQPTLSADDIEDQVAHVVSQIRLPEGWPDGAEEWLGMNDASAHNQQAQQRWERAKELYLRGDIEREEYEAETRSCLFCNKDLTFPLLRAMIESGNMIRGFAQTWARSLPIERKRLLRLVFATVFVRGNCLVAVQPTPAFLPLVLKTTTPLGESCNYGDDGCKSIQV